MNKLHLQRILKYMETLAEYSLKDKLVDFHENLIPMELQYEHQPIQKCSIHLSYSRYAYSNLSNTGTMIFNTRYEQHLKDIGVIL